MEECSAAGEHIRICDSVFIAALLTLSHTELTLKAPD